MLFILPLQVMGKYNVLFQYLLRLKRLQLELEDTWAVMRRQAARTRSDQLHLRRLPLWQVRHQMAYLVANLQIYIQVETLPLLSLHVSRQLVLVESRHPC